MMPTRYLLVLGTFLLAVLLYVDRVCIVCWSRVQPDQPLEEA